MRAAAAVPEQTTQKLYPVAVIATELNCGPKQLIERLNGAVVRDSAGVKCIPAEIVKQLTHERDEREAFDRNERQLEAKRRRKEGSNASRTIARVKAIQRQQEQVPYDRELPMHQNAIATVMCSEIEGRISESEQRMDDYMTGGIVYRKRYE